MACLVSICICTFKRPSYLKRLLSRLATQETDGAFSYSIVVVDNDVSQSAEHIVNAFARDSNISTRYFVEPIRNIAIARNRAVASAKGNFIAFIDDDEEPHARWLINLVHTCNKYNADGVLGPVIPVYEAPPPKWVVYGKFFERPNHRTGNKIQLNDARTGNLLLRSNAIEGIVPAFREKFGRGSEDVDFLSRLIRAGRVFVWCEDAVVQEWVPKSRMTSSYLLRRALIRGGNSFLHEAQRKQLIGKSIIALPCYIVMLPFLMIAGYQYFLRYLIKTCDHVGRVGATFTHLFTAGSQR